MLLPIPRVLHQERRLLRLGHAEPEHHANDVVRPEDQDGRGLDTVYPAEAKIADGTVGDQQEGIPIAVHTRLDDRGLALHLRAVGGLTTAEIAAAFLVPEATMAKRLTRAKNKIRDAGLALAMPRAELLQTRTADVLRVVYLIFSEGHQASSGDDLLRPDLCVAGVNLARGLAARRPRDPEVRHGVQHLTLQGLELARITLVANPSKAGWLRRLLDRQGRPIRTMHLAEVLASR